MRKSKDSLFSIFNILLFTPSIVTVFVIIYYNIQEMGLWNGLLVSILFGMIGFILGLIVGMLLLFIVGTFLVCMDVNPTENLIFTLRDLRHPHWHTWERTGNFRLCTKCPKKQELVDSGSADAAGGGVWEESYSWETIL